MQVGAAKPRSPKTQNAAFLVVALILLLVISAFGLASMAQTIASTRVSHNYSQYLQAANKARSIAQYAKRIMESFPNEKYPAPPTCDSATTSGSSCTNTPCPCNSVIADFPYNGRPVLAWSSGLSNTTLYGSSEPDSWWSNNGFAYEGAFGDSGNARVIVSLEGINNNSPYEHTYRIVGYATDSTNTIKATYELYHIWKGYTPDPGNGSCTLVTDACYYTQCCSTNSSCATDLNSCETGTATYVPPGWTCADYFINGLGYNSSACTNPIAPP